VENKEQTTLDATGIPTHACPNCGGITFRILASFDNYEIAWYTLTGYCYECGTKVTVPCPADADPESLV
jgi:rRNA maturation protein Nop10